MSVEYSRREALRALGLAGLGLACSRLAAGEPSPAAQPTGLVTRPIPSSGERIPVIGIGTARRYDVGEAEAERAPLREVLRRFPEMGGRLVDTAPGYGRAEAVVGDLLEELGNRDRYFLATKVSLRGGSGTREDGVRAMEGSFARLHTDRVDLMQVHNLAGTETLLPLLRESKAAGRIRYFGVSTSFDRQYAELESIMRREAMDAVQVDYAIDNRGAAERLIPLAADRGMAVLVNLPFGRTSVFQKVRGRPLPPWAAEIDATSWAQVFLKYIVSHPAVTAAIPGTATVEYLVDNLGAARGRMPDAAMRRTIERYFDAL